MLALQSKQVPASESLQPFQYWTPVDAPDVLSFVLFLGMQPCLQGM